MTHQVRREILPGSAGRSLISEDHWAEIGTTLRLAPRELQVVQGVFDDHKEFAIAHDLGISPHTVHTYLERVYRKLRVGSRVELVVRIIQELLTLIEQPSHGHGALPSVD